MNFLINFMMGQSGLQSDTASTAASAAASAAGSANSWTSTLPMFGILIVFVIIIYFFSIRPNKKREKQRKEKLSSLKKGDRVQTIGLWRANVWEIKEKTVILKIDDNTKIEVLKDAISDVVVSADEPKKTEEKSNTQDLKSVQNKEEETK